MADELIKLIEYIMANPLVQGAFIGYIVLVAIVVSAVIAVFVVIVRTIAKNRKRRIDFWRKRFW